MAKKKSAVVIGYATTDYVLELACPFSGVGTSAIKHRDESGWPRSGGAALYASRQLAELGHSASPITWIGRDEGGRQYIADCSKAGVGLEGVVSANDGRTPTCVLMYQPDGEYGCLFDSGLGGNEVLQERQRELVRCADMVLVAIGPPEICLELLDCTPVPAVVAWIAKADTAGYPMPVRQRCAERADYIFCNASERGFVDEALDLRGGRSAVIIETRGRDGVLIDNRGRQSMLPVQAVDSPDATGAGDTFAGATMASLLAGESKLEEAVRAGISAARTLMKDRARLED